MLYKLTRTRNATHIVHILYIGKNLTFGRTMAANFAFAQTIYHGVMIFWSLEITNHNIFVPRDVKNLLR